MIKWGFLEGRKTKEEKVEEEDKTEPSLETVENNEEITLKKELESEVEELQNEFQKQARGNKKYH